MNWFKKKAAHTQPQGSEPEAHKPNLRISIEGVASVKAGELLQSETGKRQLSILKGLKIS